MLAMYESRLSNKKLSDLGFQYKYPTIREGVKQVVEEYKNNKGKKMEKLRNWILVIALSFFILFFSRLYMAIRM